MKKFYSLVSSHQTSHGFEIHLDGRAVKVPSGATLYAPNSNLADAIIQEWSAQMDTIKPDTMPLTQLLTTRIDRVSLERDSMAALVLKYFNTDLLCYRAEEPDDLVAQQNAVWDVYLDRFAQKSGVTLQTTTSLIALMHDDRAYAYVRDIVTSLDDDRFTVLQLATSVSGSLLLSLALLNGDASAEDVYNAVHVEEFHKAKIYDEEKYGAAPHDEQTRAGVKRDLEACERYLSLLD